jgi:hypothetical protein
MSSVPDKARKKEIAQAWTERKRSQGVFAVRCVASGEVWVDASRNLGSQSNSIWFSLRQGGHRNKAAQAAWNTHGADAFVYDVLEEISDEDLTPLGLHDLLKVRERHWRDVLGAGSLLLA